MTSKLNILFPVETINRELDFRLFLACLCVNRKNRIFVGQSGAINRLVPQMRGGIYLGKDIFTGEPFPRVDISNYILLKQQQFKFIQLGEEGIPFVGDEKSWREALKIELNPNYLCEDDYVCTWGEFQSDFYKSRQPACQNNIYPTGHPRFDLYKPSYRSFFAADANKIREKYGEFILINTNLSYANNSLGLVDIFSTRHGYVPTNYEARTKVIENWGYSSNVLIDFVKLINRLSKEFPEEKFIIRPHPGEDWSFYQNIFNQVENVLVVHEGSVAQWLLACKLMIHDGCTTAIEAFLSGTPIINFKPVSSEKHNIFIPNSLGTKCFTDDEVIDSIKMILSDKKDALKQKDSLDSMVPKLMANFKQDCFQSVTNLIKKVESKIHNEKTPIIWNKQRSLWQERTRTSLVDTYLTISPLFGNPKDNARRSYRQQQFYGFSKKSIDSRMNRIQNILDTKVDYKIFGKNLLLIELK